VSELAPAVRHQTFSPDSTLIAYQSDVTGYDAVYVYEWATNLTRQVAGRDDLPGLQEAIQPTWPCTDSQQLMFASEAEGNFNVFLTLARPLEAGIIDILNDGESVALTRSEATDYYPQGRAWEYDTVIRIVNQR
jgi:hypothetical protein